MQCVCAASIPSLRRKRSGARRGRTTDDAVADVPAPMMELTRPQRLGRSAHRTTRNYGRWNHRRTHRFGPMQLQMPVSDSHMLFCQRPPVGDLAAVTHTHTYRHTLTHFDTFDTFTPSARGVVAPWFHYGTTGGKANKREGRARGVGRRTLTWRRIPFCGPCTCSARGSLESRDGTHRFSHRQPAHCQQHAPHWAGV